MSNGVTLYQLTADYATALATLGDLDLDEQTITDTLEGLKGTLEAKAVNVAKYAANIEAAAEAIKDAEMRMRARRQAYENRAARLKLYVKLNLEAVGLTKIDAPEFAITIKHNPPSVVIEDQSKIPAAFLVIPEAPPPSPDKKRIAEALKGGHDVPGARLDNSKTRLEIT